MCFDDSIRRNAVGQFRLALGRNLVSGPVSQGNDSGFRRISPIPNVLVGVRQLPCLVLKLLLFWGLLNQQISTGQNPDSLVDIQLVSGQKIRAAIVEVSETEITVRQANSTEIGLGYPDIARIVMAGDPAIPINNSPPHKVVLVDGSQLNAANVLVDQGKSEFTIVGERTMLLESRHLSTIRFQENDTLGESKNDWAKEVRLDTFSADALILNREGKLEGVEGVLGRLTPENVEFSIGDRTADVRLERIFAIAFYRTERKNTSDALCQVRLIDGSTINARQWRIEQSEIKVVTTSDADLSFPLAVVSQIDFGMGRELLLDIAGPATNHWEPLLANTATISALRKLKMARVNRSFSNRPLELEVGAETLGKSGTVKAFEHGFAMQGGGKLSFILKDDYRLLTGLVGFDPRASEQGCVKFTILVDDRIAMEKVLEKQKMKEPVQISIDVAGANRIVCLIDYHDGRSVGDQIHLVNLKVSK